MAATKPDFAAIVFDCDGVMVDSEAIYVEVEMRRLADIGLAYAVSDYQQRFNGLRPDDFVSAVAVEYAKLGKGSLPKTFGPDLAAEVYERMETKLQPIAGIHDLLDQVSGPCAVASSSAAHRLIRKLEMTGLSKYFDEHVYSGDFVENGKPAPDLFLYSAEKLSVDPAECLVIEDSANGVLAGIAAGMTTWGFIGGGHATSELGERLKDAGAERVFESHAEIAVALR